MVNKINGFRAPYRSSTFRDQADSLVERSGLLFLEDEVYEDSGDVVIPPFKAIQHGLIYEKPDETRVPKPASLIAPYYVTVSSTTNTDVDDLAFQFAKSPQDISFNEVIIGEYDGNEWRQPSKVSTDGVIRDLQQNLVNKGETGPNSGLLTSVVSTDYKNGKGLLVDKSGLTVNLDEDLITAIINSDPIWDRTDRMIYRRPVDNENRIGVRKVVIGGTYNVGDQTANDTLLSAAVNGLHAKPITIIAPDNTVHFLYAEGFGTSVNIMPPDASLSIFGVGILESSL